MEGGGRVKSGGSCRSGRIENGLVWLREEKRGESSV